MGDSGEIEKLKVEAEKSSFDPNAQNNLGNAYFKEGRFEEARQCYYKAIEINPNISVYYENVGLASDELSEWEVSIDAYEKATALNPSWTMFNSLGIAYFKLNQHEQAAENYRKAIELGGENAILYDNIGLALEQLG